MPDPTFDAFRRKLADAVTIAINNGVRVSASKRGCHCPLGCLPGAQTRRPCLFLSPWELAFANAFDSGCPVERFTSFPEYAALGLAYRKRFP